MLQATRDIRKVALWLGHADIRTTEVYLGMDPSEKLEAVEAVLPPALRRGRFKAPDALIASLMADARVAAEVSGRMPDPPSLAAMIRCWGVFSMAAASPPRPTGLCWADRPQDAVFDPASSPQRRRQPSSPRLRRSSRNKKLGSCRPSRALRP